MLNTHTHTHRLCTHGGHAARAKHDPLSSLVLGAGVRECLGLDLHAWVRVYTRGFPLEWLPLEGYPADARTEQLSVQRASALGVQRASAIGVSFVCAPPRRWHCEQLSARRELVRLTRPSHHARFEEGPSGCNSGW